LQGHNPTEINAALSIVEKIRERIDSPSVITPNRPTETFFKRLEEFALSNEIRGYLNRLQTMKVISPIQREELIERSLLLDPEDATLEEVENLVDEMMSERNRLPGEFDETISDYYH
jgi:uncharacterized protein Smg (DUF494 family)